MLCSPARKGQVGGLYIHASSGLQERTVRRPSSKYFKYRSILSHSIKAQILFKASTKEEKLGLVGGCPHKVYNLMEQWGTCVITHVTSPQTKSTRKAKALAEPVTQRGRSPAVWMVVEGLVQRWLLNEALQAKAHGCWAPGSRRRQENPSRSGQPRPQWGHNTLTQFSTPETNIWHEVLPCPWRGGVEHEALSCFLYKDLKEMLLIFAW